MIKKIKFCEVCDKKLKDFLSLGNHPMCDDLKKIKSKKKSKLFPISLSLCNHCLTVTQKIHIPKNILFPKGYHYRAKLTKDVLLGQKNLVSRTEKYYGSLKNKVVLDIGANDCSLLNEFKKKGAKTIAVEPTNAIIDGNNSHKKYQTYFNKKISQKILKIYGKIDFITFTNVFAHINNLKELIKNLKTLISKNTVIIIENHYLGSVLKKKQFDTFYSEHLRTYSLNSFIFVAKNLNMTVQHVEFPARYGGNIRVFLDRRDDLLKKDSHANYLNKEKSFKKEFKKIKIYINRWKSRKRNKILKLNKLYGPLPAKAFPGRAAIILKLLKLSNKNILAIYEKPNSKKIGFYAPGTNIKIVNEDKLSFVDKKIPIINLAWHINKEIKHYLIGKKIRNKIINIIENRDFL